MTIINATSTPDPLIIGPFLPDPVEPDPVPDHLVGPLRPAVRSGGSARMGVWLMSAGCSPLAKTHRQKVVTDLLARLLRRPTPHRRVANGPRRRPQLGP